MPTSSVPIRPVSLRTSLLLLVLACIVPSAILGGYLALENYRLFKGRLYSETQLQAQRLMDGVERELARIESGLRVLSTSEALRDGDMEAFHRMASEAIKSQIVYNYVLLDRKDQQIVNTLRPWGSPLPRVGNPPALARVFTTRSTVLTDFFIGPVTRRPAVAMGVPVMNGQGEVIYSLNIGLAPAKLNQLLESQARPEGWLVALIDSSGTIVGRTRDAERYVGQKATPDLRARIAKGPAEVFDGITKDGTQVVTAFVTSPQWGWTIAVGAPKDLIEAQLNRAILSVALTMGLIVSLATFLVVSLIRRLTHAVDELNNAALAIDSGQPVPPPKVALLEAEAIGRAIARVSELTSEVHHKAYHDELTDLGNRALFYKFLDKSLARALRDGAEFSLLMLDLDHFKEVNDSQGHAAGDEVLRQASQRILAQVRGGDLAARLGGDEFAVLLSNTGAEGARDVAQRLNSTLAEPFVGCEQRISASIGIAVWRPGIETSGRLMEMADQALYRVKAGGRNGALLWDGDADGHSAVSSRPEDRPSPEPLNG